jgi:hypothetical protein
MVPDYQDDLEQFRRIAFGCWPFNSHRGFSPVVDVDKEFLEPFERFLISA